MADVSTLVSILPRVFREFKPGVFPGWYEMPAVDRGDIAILHVGMGTSYVTLEEDRGTISRPIPSAEICRALVQDFCVAQVDLDDDAGPGLFWLEGKLSKEEILENHAEEIAVAVQRQHAWFTNLLQSADNDWNRYHKHNVITEWEREAARYLNVTNREWQLDTPIEAPVTCIACGMLNKPGLVICPSCHVILDKVKAEELGLTFASR